MLHFDVHRALHHNERLVGVLMVVPNKLAFEFGQLKLIVVHLCNDSRAPEVTEGGQFFCQVDGGHERLRPAALLWFISGLSGWVPSGDVIAFKRPNGIDFTRNVNFKRGQIFNNTGRVA